MLSAPWWYGWKPVSLVYISDKGKDYNYQEIKKKNQNTYKVSKGKSSMSDRDVPSFCNIKSTSPKYTKEKK
jgi:hypothetical protein